MQRRTFLGAIGAAVLGTLGYKTVKTQYTAGWTPNPSEVRRIMGSLTFPTFGDTPVGLTKDDAPDDIFGWRMVEQVSNKPYFCKDQKNVGSCVAFGTNNAVEATEAAEIVAGDWETWTPYVEEVTYGGSRYEIGGNKIKGDGSVGIWAADWCTKYGMVPRGKYGKLDLTTYNERTCRELGRTGIPDDLERVAKKYPVDMYTQINNAEDAWRAIGNLNFVQVCSDVGFENGNRDADGVLRANGTWYHCMAFIGRAVIRGKRYLFCINSHNRDYGDVGYGDHPKGGWWTEWDTCDRMLSQEDSWAFGGVRGFERKELDWSKM